MKAYKLVGHYQQKSKFPFSDLTSSNFQKLPTYEVNSALQRSHSEVPGKFWF